MINTKYGLTTETQREKAEKKSNRQDAKYAKINAGGWGK